MISVILFFFQAEDGIRDIGVTGVQTCALPISPPRARAGAILRLWICCRAVSIRCFPSRLSRAPMPEKAMPGMAMSGKRSEERRVGKESRSRWVPDVYIIDI